ncbi:MAG: permease [Clostridiales bacterium]|nr:permease [Clostridiales bacterium]
MLYLYLLAGGALAASLLKDRNKTKKALQAAWKMFIKMLPMILGIVAAVSLLLYVLPDNVIAEYLGAENSLAGIGFALIIGSVSLLPGFITFPLSGLLLRQGVSYTVLAAFTTTLMMVGIITFPMERRFFGTKLSVYRNIAGFVIALLVSLCIGLVYGEVF